MSDPKKIIMSGRNIAYNEVLDISTSLGNNKYFFLKGTVYTSGGIPLPNAAIEIYEIDDSGNRLTEDSVGVTFTMEDGTYGIPLLVGKYYSLVVYS